MSRIATIGWAATVLVPVGLLLSGCGSDPATTSVPTSATSNPAGVGTLSVSLGLGSQTPDSLPEDPGEHHGLHDSGIAQLFITFDTLRLYPMPDSTFLPPDSSGHAGPPCHPDSAARYIEVLTNPVTVDVTALSDSLSTLLTTATVPAGDYSHLALRITNAWAFTDSAQRVDVSLARPDSLLEVLSKFSVAEGVETAIDIRIDLDRSIHEVPPGSGNYVLKPVLFGEMHGPGGHGGPGGPHGPDDPRHGPGPGHPPGPGGGPGHGPGDGPGM